MIKHQSTAARAAAHLSTEQKVAIEMAEELHQALVDRGIEYLTINSEIDEMTSPGAVAAYRRKVRDAISITAITKMMFEVCTGSNGSVVFELSRARGSQFLATVIKNDIETNPTLEDREYIIRAISAALDL
jgi:hypothetical protein